jgi:hypothetical protein
VLKATSIERSIESYKYHAQRKTNCSISTILSNQALLKSHFIWTEQAIRLQNQQLF